MDGGRGGGKWRGGVRKGRGGGGGEREEGKRVRGGIAENSGAGDRGLEWVVGRCGVVEGGGRRGEGRRWRGVGGEANGGGGGGVG